MSDYLFLAEFVSKRGTCALRRVGAVIVVEGHVLATGYNGAPEAVPHCAHGLYDRPEDDPDLAYVHGSWRCMRAEHAEVRAMRRARAIGAPLRGATLYCSWRPCAECTPRIVAAEIACVVVRRGQDVSALGPALEAARVGLRVV